MDSRQRPAGMTVGEMVSWILPGERTESCSMSLCGVVDYDASNQVVGIEVLYLSKRPHPVNLMDFRFETMPKK